MTTGSEHPSGVELELIATGQGTSDTRAHVEQCEACKAYVTSLERGARAFAERRSAESFIDAIETRAETGTTSTGSPGNVRPFERLVRTRLIWAAAPLAAAAIVLLLARPAMGPRLDGPSAELGAGAPSGRDTTFKGSFVVAVVRERAGVQERIVGDVDVAPFDRVRLEISLDGPTPIAAGALGDDGAWVPLVMPTTFDAGTFFSEHALRFDATPTSGVIVVGEPAAVERARITRELSGVRVLRMRPSTLR